MASVVLPQSDLDWVHRRVEAGAAPTVEAYVSDVLRHDRQEAEETARIQALLDEGEASGVDPRSSDQIFREVFQKHFGVDG